MVSNPFQALDPDGLNAFWQDAKETVAEKIEGDIPIKPVTTEEYDALSEEEKNSETAWLVTDADGGNAGSGSSSEESAGEVYSTEETRIGTWIDGKPLYRKVFKTSLNIPANSTDTAFSSISISDLNLKEITCYRGSYGTFENGIPVMSYILNNFSYSSSDKDLSLWATSFINYDIGNIYFYYYPYKALKTNRVYYFTVILEYTKTTD